jgi:hypothetical protein
VEDKKGGESKEKKREGRKRENGRTRGRNGITEEEE